MIEIEIMIPLRKLKMFKFKNLDDWAHEAVRKGQSVCRLNDFFVNSIICLFGKVWLKLNL